MGPGTGAPLARDPACVGVVEAGAAAMRAAGAAGVPTPRVEEIVTVDGRPGMVMARVDGADGLGRLERQPWRLLGVARTMGRVHAAMHEVTAPPALPSLHDQLRERIGAAGLPDGLARFALDALAARPDGDRILHGDLHPGNLLFGEGGVAVIDWSNAARGDPAVDVARTRLLLEVAAVPDAEPGRQRVERWGRARLAAAYRRAYRRTRGLDRAEVDRWMPLRIAERPFEDIPGEQAVLVARLDDA